MSVDSRLFMIYYTCSRAGEGGEFFCIDNTNIGGVPLKCPGGYHTGEQRTRRKVE